MKNIFSYKYGAVFKGKDIKDFLKAYEAKGKNIREFRQYLAINDDDFYRFVQIAGTACGERKKGFVKVQ